MDTDQKRLLLEDETGRILACAMEVHNVLGHGFREKTYENAMAVLFRKYGIPFDQQLRFPVVFETVKIDEFMPDLIVFQGIIVNIKTVERLGPAETGQMLNYLRVTGYKVALPINFKNPRLEWKRVVC